MQLTVTSVRTALRAHRAKPQPGDRYAAVAMVLREHKNELEVLVIERAHDDRDPWSGHLAFPGGKRDESDTSLQATAERETLEEIGLDLKASAERLGALDQLAARGRRISGLVVAPFVYLSHSTPKLRPHPGEVHAHFWVPLTPLFLGERAASIHIEHEQQRYSMPGFHVEGRILWGMSYQMLHSLFGVLGIRATGGAQLE